LDRRQVLIIDDDKETAELFSTVLGLIGYQCEVALTARTALARMAATVPDLILLDMHLGIEIGGEDILYQIRSNPRFDNTRVIVVTAHSSNADVVSELSDLVLLKPVDVNQLQTLVARISSSDLSVHPIPFRDPITRLFNEAFYDTRLELAFERSFYNYSCPAMNLKIWIPWFQPVFYKRQPNACARPCGPWILLPGLPAGNLLPCMKS
jgi:CheY-like chemotaxis protein